MSGAAATIDAPDPRKLVPSLQLALKKLVPPPAFPLKLDMKLAPGQLRLKKEPSVLVLVEPSALSQPRATYNGDPTIEAPGAAGGGDPTQAAGAGVSVGAAAAYLEIVAISHKPERRDPGGAAPY